MTGQEIAAAFAAIKQKPRSAYELGYDAGRTSQPYLSCPLVGRAAREWMRGWEDGWNARTLGAGDAGGGR